MGLPALLDKEGVNGEIRIRGKRVGHAKGLGGRPSPNSSDLTPLLRCGIDHVGAPTWVEIRGLT